MASRIPLVIVGGQIQQLQAGDTINVALLNGIIESGPMANLPSVLLLVPLFIFQALHC